MVKPDVHHGRRYRYRGVIPEAQIEGLTPLFLRASRQPRDWVSRARLDGIGILDHPRGLAQFSLAVVSLPDHIRFRSGSLIII